jgi:hypothetical protein
MKKTFLTLMTVALVAAGVQTAKAGDREWAVAGKVLTGVVAASVIGHALQPRPVYAASPDYYSYSAPVYSYAPAPAPTVVYAAPPAPVYYVPAPVVVYRQPMYVAPAPVVSFGFNYNSGYHGHSRRRCW